MPDGNWRGRPGALAPADRVRVDEVIAQSENLDAAVLSAQTAAAQATGAATAATDAAATATDAAVQTQGDAAATAADRTAAEQAKADAEISAAATAPYASVAVATSATKPPSVNRVSALTTFGVVAWVRRSGGPCLGGGWIPDGLSTPEHFGAVGDGVADDTAVLVQWMEYGGDMYANATYLVAAAGPDAGGAYANIRRDVNFLGGPKCRFVAGLGLDNDILRYNLLLSTYQTGIRPSITWRGGVFDQTLQANSTVIPNSEWFPPIRPGTSVTTDGFYILGWVQDGANYFAGLSRVTIENVKFVSGDHWETAGGDSQLFVSGTKTVRIAGCEFIAGRDCGIYGSGVPEGIIPDATFEITGCVFRACNWGGAVKRNPCRVVMTNNRGFNTPQLLVVQGLSGSAGFGSIVSNNIGDMAWQVVRVDDVTGVDVFGNISVNHGPLLADGSTPTLVYPSYNCVVKNAGCLNSRFHDNVLISKNPLGAGTQLTVVQMMGGALTSKTVTSGCEAYDNKAFAGTSVIEEISGEANGNTYWNNIAPVTVAAPVVMSGAESVNKDIPISWAFTSSSITGSTTATELRNTSVKPTQMLRRGDTVEIFGTGTVAGTAGTKAIAVLINGSAYTVATLTGECEWVLDGTIVYTGSGSARLALRLITSTGQAFSRITSNGIPHNAGWTVALRGQLSNAADTITSSSFKVS